MKITFDPAKNARSIAERDLPFERAADLDWADALIVEDERNPYPERRFVAVSYLDETSARIVLYTDSGRHPGDQFSQGQRTRESPLW